MKTKSSVVLSAALVAFLIYPAAAHADTFVSPFVGISFGGDVPDPTLTYGGAILLMGRGAGVEIEVGHTPDFSGGAGAKTQVTTVSASYVAGGDLRGRGVKPYILAGLGLIRTHTESIGSVVGGTENEFAVTLAAGLVGLVNRVVGGRGEIRYFRRIQGQSETPLIPIANYFDFWRAVAGVTFRF
jgi:hypothetical protein